MSSTSTLSALIQGVLKAWFSHAPLFIAYLTGLVVVILRWRQAPRASLLALLGILLSLLQVAIMPVFYVWLPRWLAEGNPANLGERMQTVFTTLSVVGAIIQAVAFALLLAAVYAGRRPQGG